MRPFTWGRISATRKAAVLPGSSVVSAVRSGTTVTQATSGVGLGGGGGRRHPIMAPAMPSQVAVASQRIVGLVLIRMSPSSNGAQRAPELALTFVEAQTY